MKPYYSLILSIIIGIIGQLLLKAGALSSDAGKYLFLHPFTLSGLFSYFVAAMFYIQALKEIPVSVAFPSNSISYVIVAFFAFVLWKEPFGLKQFIAFILIATGIYILYKV